MHRFLIILVAAAALAVARAEAQSTSLRRKLDERSVLVAWTNEPPAASTGAVTAAATAAASDEEQEKALAEAFDLSNKGRLEVAADAFRQILAQDAANRKGRFGLGTVLIQMQRYRDALEVLEPMIAEFPDDYSLKNNVAWLYATAKDPLIRDGEKAVRLAQDAILTAPRSYNVWSTLAESYYVLGQYEKALRSAEQALRLSEMEGVSEAGREEYRIQMDKCRRALDAMSVLD